MITVIPQKDSRKEIIESKRSAVVLFYMSHCSYCQQLLPQFREFSENVGTDVIQVDISDYSSGIWEDYQIEAVPTVISFRMGEMARERTQ